MRLQFAPFHSANLRPYSLAVPHFVRYYTASEHRILRDVSRNLIQKLFFMETEKPKVPEVKSEELEPRFGQPRGAARRAERP